MINSRWPLAALSLLMAAALAGCGGVTKEEHQETVDQLAEAKASCDKANQDLAAKETELAKTKNLLEKAEKDLVNARAQHATERSTLQEQLQTEKAKAAKLTNENTKLKLAGEDAAKQLADYQKQIGDAEGKIAELEALVKRLQAQITAVKKPTSAPGITTPPQ